MELLKRYGDDPVTISTDRLHEINATERSDWWAMPKYDGWRRFVYWMDGKLTLLSKSRGAGAEARRELPRELMEQLRAMTNRWPDGTAGDVEWLGPRGGFENELIFHDLLYSAGEWVGHMGFERRHPLMTRLFEASEAKVLAPAIRVVEAYYDVDLEELFEEQRKNPKSEGLVLKRVGVPLMQSDVFKIADKVLDNYDWVKVKYRDVSHSDMARRK